MHCHLCMKGEIKLTAPLKSHYSQPLKSLHSQLRSFLDVEILAVSDVKEIFHLLLIIRNNKKLRIIPQLDFENPVTAAKSPLNYTPAEFLNLKRGAR